MAEGRGMSVVRGAWLRKGAWLNKEVLLFLVLLDVVVIKIFRLTIKNKTRTRTHSHTAHTNTHASRQTHMHSSAAFSTTMEYLGGDQRGETVPGGAEHRHRPIIIRLETRVAGAVYV